MAKATSVRSQRTPVKKPGKNLSISAAAQTKVSQTVKLDGELYVRLAAYAAAMRFTNQYILVEALTEFLDRYDGTKQKGVPI
jgi:hypothetical protein